MNRGWVSQRASNKLNQGLGHLSGVLLLAGVLLLWFLVQAICAHASVALLMEEPYGHFGAMNPTGHSAVYLNHVCAASPTELRACRPGESGVVISRYHKIDGLDWVAIPLIPYLYAVDEMRRGAAVGEPGPGGCIARCLSQRASAGRGEEWQPGSDSEGSGRSWWALPTTGRFTALR